MPVKEELRKLDRFSVVTVYNRRDALNELLKTVEDGRYVGESVELLVPTLVPAYSKRLGVSPTLIEQSLYALLGHKSNGFPSFTDCKKANWILAANVDILKSGKPVQPFDQIHWAEWVPLVLQSVKHDCNHKAELGYWYRFIAVGGTPASEQFELFIKNRKGWWFAHTKMFGLSKRTYEGLPGAEAYVGMSTWAYLDPACKFGPFERSEVTPSFSAQNRELLKQRKQPCIYCKPFTCFKCPVSRESCKFSVHSGEYTAKHCATHHGHGWYLFPVDEKETSCIECREKSRLHRKLAIITKGRTKHATASSA